MHWLLSLFAATTINVYVVDTGVNALPEITPWITKSVKDNHGHGTAIVGLILLGKDLDEPVCPEVKITLCQGFIKGHTIAGCLKSAATGAYDFINISGGGDEEDENERVDVKRLTDGGSIIVAAAGNENKPLIGNSQYYPASYALEPGYVNIRAVGNGTSLLDKAPSSNYGNDLVWLDGRDILGLTKLGGRARMSGTSASAALLTHEYIMRYCNEHRRW